MDLKRVGRIVGEVVIIKIHCILIWTLEKIMKIVKKTSWVYVVAVSTTVALGGRKWSWDNVKDSREINLSKTLGSRFTDKLSQKKDKKKS